MKTRIILLIVVILCFISCDDIISIFAEHYWPFRFWNNTQAEIAIIIDLNPEDIVITQNSEAYHIRPNDYMEVLGGTGKQDRKWSQIVKDSIHIYVLDASFYDIPSAPLFGPVSKDIIDSITEDMILSRMTLLHSDFVDDDKRIPTFYYPPKK